MRLQHRTSATVMRLAMLTLAFGFALLPPDRAGAGVVSLFPEEVRSLRALTDPRARKQFADLRDEAESALKDDPKPIGNIETEGRLAKDDAKHKTGLALRDMEKLTALVWVWAVIPDPRYSTKARDILLAWARVNEPDGDPIDETNLEAAIVAYDLLKPVINLNDRQTIEGWLKRLAEAEWKGPGSRTNNWQSHRLKIVGLVGYTLEDTSIINKAIDGFKEQIEKNLKPDGSSIDFHDRDALHYHVYDVAPLLTLAIAAERHGTPLFEYRSKSGASLRAAVDFIVPFAEGKQQHIEFTHSKVPFDAKRASNGQKEYEPHPWNPKSAIGVFCLASWFRPEYGILAAKLSGGMQPEVLNWRMVLNSVTRRPSDSARR